MRLIDADVLKESMEENVVSMSVCLNMSEHFGMVTMKERCIENVNAAPTIGAIPVEWILNKVGDEETYTLKYRHAWGQLVGLWAKEQEAIN